MANMANMENENPMDKRELTVEQRLFLALQKEKGVLYPQIISQFSEKWPNKLPPTRSGVYKIWKKLHNHHTLETRRKGHSGRSRTARSAANIQAVKEALEAEVGRKPDEIGSSSRRNNLDISKSSFNRITRKDLKLVPYKILSELI